MKPTPLLLLDFDGVLNFEAPLKTHKRAPNTPGYLRKITLGVNGFGYTVSYASEIPYRLNALKRTHPYEWLWLSTWRHETTQFHEHLNTDDDGYVPWKESDGEGIPGYMVNKRNAAKLAHVLRINKETPRPFVWVDDEATVNFTSNLLQHPQTPHLIIAPDAQYGLTHPELKSIEEFMYEYS